MKVLLAYPANAARVDGIRDYATRVVAQLRMEGVDAVLLRPPRGLSLACWLMRTLPRREPAVLIVQYNPLSWGRWGVALGLVLALPLVRLVRPNVKLLLTVHEAYMPLHGFRWSVMGIWQRAQIRALFAPAHSVIATVGYLADELASGPPKRPIRHVPVGSNLPDMRSERSRQRRLNEYDGKVVLASFSAGHISHLHNYVAAAAAALSRTSELAVVLLLLGSNNTRPSSVPGVDAIVVPGYLDGRSLARALSSADLFLAPFSDGATTHRTTLAAALQHGVPVVTTESHRTEAVLRADRAIAFVGVDSPDEFATEVVRLASDSDERERMSAAGRALYERCFDWPVVSAGLRLAVNAAIEDAAPGDGGLANE